MESPADISRRKDALEKELSGAARGALFWAHANHWLSIVLMVLALGCSVLAATLGFFTKTPSHIVGGIAILPPLIAFVAQNLKCEAKNSWHARRVDGLKGLRSRLLYRIPEPPTFDQVAKIAKDRDELEVKMQTEWDNTLLLKWSGVFSHRDSKQLSSGSSAAQGLD